MAPNDDGMGHPDIVIAAHPSLFRDRNFAVGMTFIFIVGINRRVAHQGLQVRVISASEAR